MTVSPMARQLMPTIEIWNNASSSASNSAAAAFSLKLTVTDAAGKSVATSSGSGSVGGGDAVEWSPDSSIKMPAAKLWHVATGVKPALYTLLTELTVGGKVVDSVTQTFGVRATAWSNATGESETAFPCASAVILSKTEAFPCGAAGFWLNGKPLKILGNANHQDFPAVGVAVPDHLQWYRVQAQMNWCASSIMC